MTERERLINILDRCIEANYPWETNDEIADYLLANGVLAPPCKVGDVVYYIENDQIYKDKVIGVTYSEDYDFITKSVRTFDCLLHWGSFGNTVFLTREEAEKALAERSDNE